MKSASIYLASRSPRRRELLDQIGVQHEVLDVEVDESWDGEEPARVHATRLALNKAQLGWAKVKDTHARAVLAADTVVALDDMILGKAEKPHEAMAMLRQLSGRSHWVLTGVALIDAQGIARHALSTSRVVFRTLSIEEVRGYVDTGEPLGKAGAYAIQGLAAMYIERIEGSYSGVMGLPLYETASLLRAAEILDLEGQVTREQ
ncbi:MAG: Maf family protein [Gammaproteobacteria bacterium]